MAVRGIYNCWGVSNYFRPESKFSEESRVPHPRRRPHPSWRRATLLHAIVGMADDYYTDVPPDPPDDQADLYVDALVGLTADAR